MNYYIADPHFGHTAAIQFDNRPFADALEMDKTMIELWNAKVTDKDNVYILGDLAFHYTPGQVSGLLRRLKGKKHLIKGNHDSFVGKDGFDPSSFIWIKDYHRMSEDGQRIILCHYPIAVWDSEHHGALHLYGHVHNNYDRHPVLLSLKNAYNAFVGINNYTPCTLREIIDNNQIFLDGK